jgi:G:T-mismatch repair DNA endonuclease (very short patch repair protein)
MSRTPTFAEIAAQHGVAEVTMRRLLRSVGVEPRARGKRLIEVESPDLVLADWRGGLGCRAVAEKLAQLSVRVDQDASGGAPGAN